MNHYEIAPFDAPARASAVINAFFQAKYGMFSCFDSERRPGGLSFDPNLVAYWERNPK